MLEATAKDPVEVDQYRKIHNLADKLEQLTGVVQMSNEINRQLVDLMKKALKYMFWIIVLLIGTVIYGAIGEKGFYAVRHGIDVAMMDSDPILFDEQRGALLTKGQ